MLGPDAVQIHFSRIGRKIHRKRDTSSGQAVVGGGKAGRVSGNGVVAFPLRNVNDLDLNRTLRTSADARGFAAFREAVVTHVAFADDPAFWRNATLCRDLRDCNVSSRMLRFVLSLVR